MTDREFEDKLKQEMQSVELPEQLSTDKVAARLKTINRRKMIIVRRSKLFQDITIAAMLVFMAVGVIAGAMSGMFSRKGMSADFNTAETPATEEYSLFADSGVESGEGEDSAKESADGESQELTMSGISNQGMSVVFDDGEITITDGEISGTLAADFENLLQYEFDGDTLYSAMSGANGDALLVVDCSDIATLNLIDEHPFSGSFVSFSFVDGAVLIETDEGTVEYKTH